MITLAELQESMGVSTAPIERTPVATRTASTARTEDMRCPRCKMVKLTVAERCGIVPYTRSVCTGALTCSECHGMSKSGLVWCDKCDNKGYVLKFEKRWFDYACSACVYEARKQKSGLSKASTARFTSVPTVKITYHVPTVEQVALYKEANPVE